jgi:hypothetical protein
MRCDARGVLNRDRMSAETEQAKPSAPRGPEWRDPG